TAKREGEADWWGGRLKVFANGNAHLLFDPDALDMVNKGLAEYYGEVLPDAPEENAKPQPGTDVARDLQFYRTPDRVADELVDRAGLRDGMSVLEPSCGDGAILKALSRFGRVRAVGYEIDPTRAATARLTGYGVVARNFLDVPPEPIFDRVLMNPPFYGRHYQKHVEHARRFLKPDGVLYAILPVTAATDHGFVDAGRRGHDSWRDLPVGSFAESGTRINTGIARFFAHNRP
ncbi:MAG: adenine methyltransferase, partial [Octadecabacter sp.]|nr:adenine methyltransferase [Octadecabacter sp.]